MTNGTNFLNYDLYTDSGHAIRWGNVSGSWVSGTVTGSAQLPALGIIVFRSADNTVYGRIPGSQATVQAATSTRSTSRSPTPHSRHSPCMAVRILCKEAVG